MCQENNVRGVPFIKLKYPSKLSNTYVSKELQPQRDVKVLEQNILQILPEYVSDLKTLNKGNPNPDNAGLFVLYTSKTKATPFFIKSIAAENLSDAVFVHSNDSHDVELLLGRNPTIDALYFKNDKLNVAVKMEKKVNHPNVMDFIETCQSRSKIRTKGGPADLGLQISWNAKDIELRAKFYDGWFQKSHHYKFLKDEITTAGSSMVTVLRGSDKIYNEAIDKIDIEKIFSHTFKEDL